MAVEIVEQNGKPGNAECELDVSFSGLTITVTQGLFVMEGEELAFAENIDHVVIPDTKDVTDVYGYLCKHRDNGTPHIVVDEYVHNSEASLFDFGSSVYQPLHLLFHTRVAANETDLANTTINVYHVKEISEEGEEQ